MRNLPLALPGVWELYPSAGRKVTIRNCYFRQSDFGTPEAVTQGVRDTQYQQATPLDYHTGFLSGSPAAACQGESLKPSENEKGESNNVEVYLWSISRWHYRSSVDVLVAD